MTKTIGTYNTPDKVFIQITLVQISLWAVFDTLPCVNPAEENNLVHKFFDVTEKVLSDTGSFTSSICEQSRLVLLPVIVDS